MNLMPNSATASQDRALGCLTGLATGNVLGLAIESCNRKEVRLRLGSEGPLLRLPTEEQNRDWDDDLAMAMALSECLIELPEGSDHLDTSALAAAYLQWLKTGSRGIGLLTREVLTKVLCGDPQAAETVWREREARGQRPLGNGAAMRIAPLGIACASQPERIMDLAAEDAAITHWDLACRQSAGLIALLAAASIRGERAPLTFARVHAGPLLPEVVQAFEPLSLGVLAKRGLDDWDMGSTLLALQVAVSMLSSGLPFADALPWLLRQGGDTDTNGAIVGALLGARDGHSAIPVEWRACVAEGDRILAVARQLYQRSGLLQRMEVP